MSTVTRKSAPGKLTLYGVSWGSYTRLLRAFDRRPAVRLTYDFGTLEIMTISHEHESDGEFLGRLAETLSEELGMPLKAGGSTTFRRRRALRGLEPDQCFWILSESKVRGKRKIDLEVDPPPDLAIEVDITHSSLPRLDIYATLGVLEVWRYDGEELTFHLLQRDGDYREVSSSRMFPGVRPKDIVRFLNMRFRADENAVIREFRTWVRERFVDRR